MDRFPNTRQPDWDWWGQLWPTPGATLQRLGVSFDASLVEIGCGNGYFALPAARITDPAPVYALDLDETLLDELTDIADREAIHNVVPIHGDARDLTEHLPTPVDTALIANTFHGVDDVAGLVREVVAALEPGGCFIVVNWVARPRASTTVAGEARGPPMERRLSAGATETAVFDAADCRVSRRLDLPPYHYALVFER